MVRDFITKRKAITSTIPTGRSMYALFINAERRYITKEIAATLIA